MIQVPAWRVVAVGVVLAACLITLLVKAGRLQLVLGDDLRSLAENQYLRRVQLAAPRGSITDRHGRPLAVSVPAWSVSARPGLVEDKPGAAQALAAALGVDARELQAKLVGEQKFVWLKRRASGDVAEAVRALGIPGVELKQEMRRMWPQKGAAAQVLGLVDVDGRARGGVELAYDDSLQGRASSVAALADNKGSRIALPGAAAGALALELLEGDDVVLTIDLSIQHEAEEAVQSAVVEHGARAAWAIAMDARSGALLAVANAPAYNPNAPEPDRARNRAFAEAFEPGSIFKIATFAAALDAGVVKPEDRIFCENGRYQLGKHVIHDTHRAEWLTATEVFQHSSNIGTLKIAQRVGEDRMKEALVRFGFGARPGTGLSDESAGRLPPASRWGDARLATISFGHGVLVTALQMTSFVQAVANGGVRKTPWLLDHARASTGEVVRTAAMDDGDAIMSPAAAATLTEIMKSVARPGGTGTLAAIAGIDVAGKTGTAEKVDPITRRYSKDLHLSSFIGFAPADDPRVVAVVIVDEPRGQHYGGVVAAPAWRRIVESALIEEGVLAQGQLASIDEPKKKKKAKGDQQGVRGRGEQQTGARETAGQSARRLAGLSVVGEGPSSPAVPGVALDLRGFGARAALREAEKAGVELILEGSGVVVRQDPAPGTALPPGGELKVVLAAHAPGGRAPGDTR
jgi:cell division protein FtsI (penicillin-binding protein 3)